MKAVWLVIRTLWCLVAAYIPIAIKHINQRLWIEIGCTVGDCYRPGTSASFELDVLTVGTAIIIWPVCLWFLIGKFVVVSFRKKTTTEDV